MPIDKNVHRISVWLGADEANVKKKKKSKLVFFVDFCLVVQQIVYPSAKLIFFLNTL